MKKKESLFAIANTQVKDICAMGHTLLYFVSFLDLGRVSTGLPLVQRP